MAKPAPDPTQAPLEPKSAPIWDEDRFRRIVRKAAKRKGITLGEAARLAGTTPNWLTQPALKTGRGIEKVLQIADVLDIDPVELLTGVRSAVPSTVHARMRLLSTIATVTAHLVAALQMADTKDADRIIRVSQTALIQVLKEIESGDDGRG